ncbi:MAG: hypothetical protein BGP24_22960 [Lysobacterales bacterium 69-70]|nr:MAG: hypothetical protein ABS97_09140 [Xanthomonadaceae bacterium SCN 69-320]ODV22361.1 MAG: hypothetical protein ABT27_01300 [Xanthomonadaceae bacterium SCN 69-25]OJY96158.1 MAG: hypothetical protein BGP24_22960 [Xanthomonadales bacterium 69-70]
MDAELVIGMTWLTGVSVPANLLPPGRSVMWTVGSVEKSTMRKYLPLILLLLFVLATVWQCLFWAGAASLPGIGSSVRRSAMREAPLVATYTFGGELLGKVAPALGDVGRSWAEVALRPAAERLEADPGVAMDFIFGESLNATQRTATRGVYLPPVLLLLALVAWLRRPRQVRMMGSRRR